MQINKYTAAWRAGNNAGEGFAPIITDRWTLVSVESEETDEEVRIYQTPGGRTIAVADLHGEWAVEVCS